MEQDITLDDVAAFSHGLDAYAPYVVARNAATSAGVRAAARNPLPYRAYRDTYSVSLTPTGDVTNQRQSGRCWLFAALNVLRDRMMASLGTKNLELSEAYLQFWDKLEKANLFLEEMIRLADEPLDGRAVTLWMRQPIGDGGWWDMAVALIEKYGVMPQQCMPDTANSRATSDMNDLLARKLRRDAVALRAAASEGTGTEGLRALKRTMLGEVYRMLAIALGEPPATFDFDYVADARPEPKGADGEGDGEKGQDGAEGAAADGGSPEALAALKAKKSSPANFVRLHDMTPRGFLEAFGNVNLHDYVSLCNIPGVARPFGSMLRLQRRGTVAGVPIRMLNMPVNVLKDGLIAQLKAGHPAWFSCDVLKNLDRSDPSGLLDTETVDARALFGLDLSLSKADAFDTREVTLNHAMTFQGVNLREDGTPTAWRIENSWGKDKCREGYLVITDRWFDAYVGQVVIHRDYLPDDVVRIWDDPSTPVVEMDPWSPMFGCSD